MTRQMSGAMKKFTRALAYLHNAPGWDVGYRRAAVLPRVLVGDSDATGIATIRRESSSWSAACLEINPPGE